MKGDVTRDFNAIRQVLDRLSQADDASYEAEAPEELAALREGIERAKQLIATTESLLPKIDQLEIGLRLELVVERAITNALAVLRRPSTLIESLVPDSSRSAPRSGCTSPTN